MNNKINQENQKQAKTDESFKKGKKVLTMLFLFYFKIMSDINIEIEEIISLDLFHSFRVLEQVSDKLLKLSVIQCG